MAPPVLTEAAAAAAAGAFVSFSTGCVSTIDEAHIEDRIRYTFDCPKGAKIADEHFPALKQVAIFHACAIETRREASKEAQRLPEIVQTYGTFINSLDSAGMLTAAMKIKLCDKLPKTKATAIEIDNLPSGVTLWRRFGVIKREIGNDILCYANRNKDFPSGTNLRDMWHGVYLEVFRRSNHYIKKLNDAEKELIQEFEDLPSEWLRADIKPQNLLPTAMIFWQHPTFAKASSKGEASCEQLRSDAANRRKADAEAARASDLIDNKIKTKAQNLAMYHNHAKTEYLATKSDWLDTNSRTMESDAAVRAMNSSMEVIKLVKNQIHDVTIDKKTGDEIIQAHIHNLKPPPTKKPRVDMGPVPAVLRSRQVIDVDLDSDDEVIFVSKKMEEQRSTNSILARRQQQQTNQNSRLQEVNV